MTQQNMQPAGAPADPDVRLASWAKGWLDRWREAYGAASLAADGELILGRHRHPAHAWRWMDVAHAEDALRAELQGTVGGRRAVTALVAQQKAQLHAIVQADPALRAISGARSWLSRWQAAGGGWSTRVSADGLEPILHHHEGANRLACEALLAELAANPPMGAEARGLIIMGAAAFNREGC